MQKRQSIATTGRKASASEAKNAGDGLGFSRGYRNGRVDVSDKRNDAAAFVARIHSYRAAIRGGGIP